MTIFLPWYANVQPVMIVDLDTGSDNWLPFPGGMRWQMDRRSSGTQFCYYLTTADRLWPVISWLWRRVASWTLPHNNTTSIRGQFCIWRRLPTQSIYRVFKNHSGLQVMITHTIRKTKCVWRHVLKRLVFLQSVCMWIVIRYILGTSENINFKLVHVF